MASANVTVASAMKGQHQNSWQWLYDSEQVAAQQWLQNVWLSWPVAGRPNSSWR